MNHHPRPASHRLLRRRAPFAALVAIALAGLGACSSQESNDGAAPDAQIRVESSQGAEALDPGGETASDEAPATSQGQADAAEATAAPEAAQPGPATEAGPDAGEGLNATGVEVQLPEGFSQASSGSPSYHSFIDAASGDTFDISVLPSVPHDPADFEAALQSFHGTDAVTLADTLTINGQEAQGFHVSLPEGTNSVIYLYTDPSGQGLEMELRSTDSTLEELEATWAQIAPTITIN